MMTNIFKNVILNLSLVYVLCVVKPCGSSLDDRKSSSSPRGIIIIEDAKSMRSRLFNSIFCTQSNFP